MDELAKDTGGQAFFNTNGLGDALTRVSNAGAYFYTLSYVPPNEANDGAFHKIQVKLPGSYKLSYRRGYFASDPAAEAIEEAKSRRDPAQHLHGPRPARLNRNRPRRTRHSPTPRDPNPRHRRSPESSPIPPNPAAKLAPAGDNPRLGGALKRYSVDFLLTAHGIQLAAHP
jgi:hypothetical protein